MSFPLEFVREQFPSLVLSDDGRPRIYADNPAGTQVPASVAQAISDRMLGDYSNLGGHFSTTRSCDELYLDVHDRAAEFLGAASGREVILGQSMTMLTFHLSRSICRDFSPGDEIVITRMEHEGNVGPWLQIAEDKGLTIRWVPFSTESWQVEADELSAALSDRTRLVCLNHASNMTGAINNVAALTAVAKQGGALVYVDAVQSTPHLAIDVQQLGCDFLACSAYKFFGPHLGLLWGREELLVGMHPYKGRCVSDELPERYELGTPQLELLAGLVATFDYFDALGAHIGATGKRRDRIEAAYAASQEYELDLTWRLISKLKNIHGLRIFGITELDRMSDRVPTVSFRVDRRIPSDIAAALANENIFVWHGHNYAYEPARQLAMPIDEGVVRVGLAHYNTAYEVDQIVAAIDRATQSRAA